MNKASIAVIAFLLGATLSGLIGFKLQMELGYQTVISKLADNTIFYQQIEQGQPALTQSAIASSLERFIYLADDAEASIWLSPSQHDKQIVVRAKKLQAQLESKQSPM
ncbi:hypothetical protein [Pseudoalteromonas atlantica]|uniref:hypothetical protein n=1 Tax=Pseudoalteromonas atlantica TaxID=288 RepID=UPI0037364E04